MSTKNLHVSTELHTQDLELLKGETLFTHGNWQVDFEDSTPQYALLILYIHWFQVIMIMTIAMFEITHVAIN